VRLLTFKGGVHPPEKKELAREQKIQIFPIPKTVYVFLSNHAGVPAKCVVKQEDRVKTGQIIGEPSGFISAYVHSPLTGVVKNIEKIYHPVHGKPMEAVVIEQTDDEEEWELLERKAWESSSKEEILEIIKKAGIVGLGGAMFPTHVKLSPPPEKKIDTLIINGAECEPYLTIDYRLMLENAEEMLQGILITMKVLSVKEAHVGIESNKMDAVQHLRKIFKNTPIKVHALKTKYPQGAEKQLIHAITKRKVPAGGLPMDVGVVVQNVGTIIAIKKAVVDGMPLVERGLTVTGEAITKPFNAIVRIGTPISQLLEAGGITEDAERVNLGGHMMATAVNKLETPVLKGTSGITALRASKPWEEKPCIRCGKCITACPMGLEPYLLNLLSSKKRYDDAVNNGLLNCIECGSCAYDCPSKIDHVRSIKLAKKVYLALRGGKK